VAAGLQERGHATLATPGWMSGWGPVSVIAEATDDVVGAADPRVVSTAAIGA